MNNIKEWLFVNKKLKEKRVNLLTNDNLIILKNNEITENEITENEITENEITENEITENEITENELINDNAEKERLQLIETFRLPLKSTWKDIVIKNDELIEKQSIKIK